MRESRVGVRREQLRDIASAKRARFPVGNACEYFGRTFRDEWGGVGATPSDRHPGRTYGCRAVPFPPNENTAK